MCELIEMHSVHDGPGSGDSFSPSHFCTPSKNELPYFVLEKR